MPARRMAQFVSAVCVCLPGGAHKVYQGECPGTIGFEERGTNGFGYDPLFIPDEVGVGDACVPNEEQRTYAQLSADEKDAISHRARALARLEEDLPHFLADNATGGNETC